MKIINNTSGWFEGFLGKFAEGKIKKTAKQKEQNSNKITKLSYADAQKLQLLSNSNYIGHNIYSDNAGVIDLGSIWYVESDASGKQFLVKKVDEIGNIVRSVKAKKASLNKKAEKQYWKQGGEPEQCVPLGQDPRAYFVDDGDLGGIVYAETAEEACYMQPIPQEELIQILNKKASLNKKAEELIGQTITIPKALTTDPVNKQGETGKIISIQPDGTVVVEFEDGVVGRYFDTETLRRAGLNKKAITDFDIEESRRYDKYISDQWKLYTEKIRPVQDEFNVSKLIKSKKKINAIYNIAKIIPFKNKPYEEIVSGLHKQGWDDHGSNPDINLISVDKDLTVDGYSVNVGIEAIADIGGEVNLFSVAPDVPFSELGNVKKSILKAIFYDLSESGLEVERKYDVMLDATASIEDDTPILPGVVADSVFDEFLALIPDEAIQEEMYNKKDAYVEQLENKANQIYENNLTFKKKINSSGDNGRDYLYMYMRHWFSALVKRNDSNLFQYIPDDFRMGAEITAKKIQKQAEDENHDDSELMKKAKQLLLNAYRDKVISSIDAADYSNILSGNDARSISLSIPIIEKLEKLMRVNVNDVKLTDYASLQNEIKKIAEGENYDTLDKANERIKQLEQEKPGEEHEVSEDPNQPGKFVVQKKQAVLDKQANEYYPEDATFHSGAEFSHGENRIEVPYTFYDGRKSREDVAYFTPEKFKEKFGYDFEEKTTASLSKQAGYNITVLLTSKDKKDVKEVVSVLSDPEIAELGINFGEPGNIVQSSERGYSVSFEAENIDDERFEQLSEVVSDVNAQYPNVSIDLGAEQIEVKEEPKDKDKDKKEAPAATKPEPEQEERVAPKESGLQQKADGKESDIEVGDVVIDHSRQDTRQGRVKKVGLHGIIVVQWEDNDYTQALSPDRQTNLIIRKPDNFESQEPTPYSAGLKKQTAEGKEADLEKEILTEIVSDETENIEGKEKDLDKIKSDVWEQSAKEVIDKSIDIDKATDDFYKKIVEKLSDKLEDGVIGEDEYNQIISELDDLKDDNVLEDDLLSRIEDLSVDKKKEDTDKDSGKTPPLSDKEDGKGMTPDTEIKLPETPQP